MDERTRLASLRSLDLLDTDSEEAFDRLTRLAAEALGAPMAVTSLVDEARVWLKSKVGVDETEMPREESFCTHTVQGRQVLVVEDASLDPRFAYFPIVTEAGIRFYAGAPVALGSGAVVGAVCVFDTTPRRSPDAAGVALLQGLAAAVGHLLDLRRELIRRREAERMLAEHARLLALAEEMAGVGHWRLDLATGDLHLSPAVLDICGLDTSEPAPGLHTILALHDPADHARTVRRHVEARAGVRCYSVDARLRRADDGSARHVKITARVELGGDGEPIALIGVCRDASDERKALEQLDVRLLDADRRADRLSHLASTDALTGLPNRRAFLDRAREVLARETGVSLAILDIDHFKSINDRFGHDVGDIALAAFGEACLRYTGDDCIFGRIGGEEFAVLVLGRTGSDAAQLVERLRVDISSMLIAISPGAGIRLSFSAGVSRAGFDEDWSSLFARADAALYRAKIDGRDRVATAA
jgi:diguanylate cyclase (GGDEF)-like protein